MAINGARNYRPRFHYTPEKGWINDPNGLLFDGKTYHLFAQHYPSVENIGPMHWSHAVSDDLIHWRHLPCIPTTWGPAGPAAAASSAEKSP